MSSIDDRIVRMGFDNAKFESGAAKTMSTLDKLNEKLKLKGASEASDNVQHSLDRVNFSSMERGIAALEKRFSTMGVVSMNVINKISDSIVGTATKLEQITLGQIKSGGWSRAMNIANAKFQIEGLGFDWSQIEEAVSYGVKDTAYGLDAAATAASQLAASGVDFQNTLETVNGTDLTAMHKSLRAISGVAAMTNSSYEDISRIFTTVAGNGRLMGDQLLQLSSRGMNAAAKLAEVLGTTEFEVRDMVTKGQIDFQTFAFAMDDAFGEHAKEANKTLTGALSNTKAALSRIGEIFASPVINKTNTVFIALTERIDEFKNKLKSITVPRSLDEIKAKYDGISLSATAYDQILKSVGERTVSFADDFSAMWQSGVDAFTAMIKSVDISWFDKIVEKVDSVTVKIKEFFDLIKEIYGDAVEESAESINEVTETLQVSAEEAQAAQDIILKGMYGAGAARKEALTELFGGGEEGAKHAANVQTYIDSVVAAGWSFENAAIKVAEANEEVAESEENLEQESKKARLKAILDSIGASFTNLWITAKNFSKAAFKIGGSVFKAFASVFKIDFTSVTGGVSSLTGVLARFSEKLIISDNTAEKITVVFTKLFTAVKNGGNVLKNAGKRTLDFVQSIGDTKAFISAKKHIGELYQKLKDFSNSDFFDSLKEKISGFFGSFSGKDVLSSVKSFFSGIGESFGNISIPESLKNSEVFSIISDFISEIKSILDDDTDIPTKISNFLNKLADAINNIDIIDTGKAALTVWGVFSLAKLFFAINDIGNMITSITAVPDKINAMVSNLGKMFNNLGVAAVNTSKVLVIKAAATAILEIVGSLIIISQIPANDIYRATSVLVVIVGVLSVMMKMVAKTSKAGASIKASLVSLTAFSANIIAVASLIAAVGGAIILVAAAFAIINKTVSERGDVGVTQFLIIIGTVIAFVGLLAAIGAKLKKEYIAAESVLPIFFSLSLLMVSFGGAMVAVASAIAIISALSDSGFTNGIVTMSVFILGLMGILEIAQFVSPDQALAVALAMVGIEAAMNLMAGAIAVMSLIKFNFDALESLVLGVAAIAVLGGVIAALSQITNNTSAIATIIVGVLAIESLLGVITGVFVILTGLAAANSDALAQASNVVAMMTILVGVIAAILGIGAHIGGENDGSTDGLFALGAAFIMVAGSMLILAVAIEKITSLGSGLTTAAIAFGIFAGVITVLAVAGTIFPTFSAAMEAIGSAFMKAGIGAALVGAGIYLVCAAVEKLSPAIMILAINLDALFTVLEEHKVTAIIVGVAVIAIIAAIIFAIQKLSPVLTAIANTITAVMQRVGQTLNSGTSKLKSWVSNLSTKGKATIVALIATLCGAILKASPTVLDTVGQLLIKLLSYLGSIAGDLALGLVDFLINLINGLVDAIQMNTNRIANALWGVIVAIVQLAWNIIGQVLSSIFGDGVMDFFDSVSDQITETLQHQRQIAEEADSAKRDYVAAIREQAGETEAATSRSINAMEGLTQIIGNTVDNQTSELDALREEYAGLPGYAYDAILRSKQSQANASAATGSASGSAYTNSFGSALQNGGEGLDSEALLSEYGLDAEGMSLLGADSGEAFTLSSENAMYDPEGYYNAMDDNQEDGTIRAIEDNEPNVKKAIKKHVNGAATSQIREGRPAIYEAGTYTVSGLVQAIRDRQPDYVAEMVALARAGNEAFQAEMDINSPSKVSYKNGEYIVVGLVNAIDRNVRLVTDSMSGLSDAIIVSFGNPLDYISKIASGELVCDTSIRPVFDDSGLYKGAASVDSMFANQKISIGGLSGQIAADIATLGRSNADVVNEIRALREDMSYMEDVISQMQVVMDTGALVGTMAGPMDKALGQRQNRRGRGN